jgi:hypothetical protein
MPLQSSEEKGVPHSTDENDEDISRSPSPEAPPLNNASRNPARAGSSTGPGTKARSKASVGAKIFPIASQKPSVSRPAVPNPTVSPKHHYPPPTVKVTKLAGKQPNVPSKPGRRFSRGEMQAGSTSKDLKDIGTKGKQAERAGEMTALDRRGSGSAGQVSTIPELSNPYGGISMRKARQGSGSNARRAPTSAGPSSRIGNATPNDSSVNVSPVGILEQYVFV